MDRDDIPSGYNLPPGCFQKDIDEYFEGSRRMGKRKIVHKWHEFLTCGASIWRELCGWQAMGAKSVIGWRKVTCKRCLRAKAGKGTV